MSLRLVEIGERLPLALRLHLLRHGRLLRLFLPVAIGPDVVCDCGGRMLALRCGICGAVVDAFHSSWIDSLRGVACPLTLDGAPIMPPGDRCTGWRELPPELDLIRLA